MILRLRTKIDLTRAFFNSLMPAKLDADEAIDETDYNKRFNDRLDMLRAQSTQLSPRLSREHLRRIMQLGIKSQRRKRGEYN